MAIKSYSRALKLCPKDFVKDRAILFSNRAACRMKKVSTDENHRCNCKPFLLIFIHSFRILFIRLFCPMGFFPTLLHLQSVSPCVELAQTNWPVDNGSERGKIRWGKIFPFVHYLFCIFWTHIFFSIRVRMRKPS